MYVLDKNAEPEHHTDAVMSEYFYFPFWAKHHQVKIYVQMMLHDLLILNLIHP